MSKTPSLREKLDPSFERVAGDVLFEVWFRANRDRDCCLAALELPGLPAERIRHHRSELDHAELRLTLAAIALGIAPASLVVDGAIEIAALAASRKVIIPPQGGSGTAPPTGNPR